MVLAILLLALAARLGALHRASVSSDEFALLHLADTGFYESN